ncbi:MAG: SUMF1/EgtB/PvdO family nonheme iron enzyme [Planctomycetes bacterium]|nr:SUMF1/EgtB/PvdO family nonheme iron enzyme [Planctomycetota bacterium]
MIRYPHATFWTVLLAAALALAACGRGGSKADTWTPDAAALSDEGPGTMVSVPAGEAQVGVKYSKIVSLIREDKKGTTLLRPLKIDAFQIDKYEVTNHNYYLFLKTLSAEQRKAWRPCHHILNVPHPHWTSSHYKSGRANYPVTGIPFEAAEAYAQWRGKRLPGEFEWEYAARGTPAFIFGAASDSYQPRKMNVADHWRSSPDLVAVNEEPNSLDVGPFGCVGMGGNASEWCTSNEIREFNVLDKDGKVVQGQRQRFRLRAYRGPNFESAGDLQCVLSFQGYMDPMGKTLKDKTLIATLGFRCAR